MTHITKLFLLSIFLNLNFIVPIFSCSMFKITYKEKTIVGTNFDAYYTTPTLWFENANARYKYGAAFSGGRIDGSNGIAPQSGQNQEGLSFSRLASHTPKNKKIDSYKRKQINNPTLYLKNVLHNCKNVDEVFTFISQYDHSYFNEDVFIYIDRSGKYLIVEPYTLTFGEDSKYVLSNFCPSVTSDAVAHKLPRYHNGVSFLQNRIDSTLTFATKLIDTMHVCRAKIGDGTLLSSIWDLKQNRVTLYFYHDYSTAIDFDINDALKKGDHSLNIVDLFPKNSEFEQLLDYKIPQNNIVTAVFLVACFILFGFSILYLLIRNVLYKTIENYKMYQLMMAAICALLCYYIIILFTNKYIFYFPSPYEGYQFSFFNLEGYIPIVSLVILLFLFKTTANLKKDKTWTSFPKILFTIDNFAIMVLCLLFFYWGLYDVI
jgi:hypothetical protein